MATALGVDPGSLSLDELEAELATLASHLYAGTCRWLELVSEFDRRGGFADSGRASLSEWLAWRCALTPRSAREHVRVARSLPGLPLIHAAFARGELSYAKVRALTRIATAPNEGELLDLAAGLTAAQLERALSAYRRVTTGEARDLQEGTYLAVSWEPDGSLSLRGRLAPEDGALLLRALEAMRDARWRKERGSAEPRPARQATNAEALVAVADAALAHEGESRPGGERYQIVVHTDESALAHDGDGGCQLDDGPALAAETARRLACDASITRNGRKTRTIPPPLRRALKTRDRGCRFPGCDNRRFLDAHHLHHWARGGPTTLANLVLLCRRHHQLVHEGGWHIDQRARFHDPRGHPLPAAPPLPRGHPDHLAQRNRDLAIDARTLKPGTGDPLPLADTVHALLTISPYRVALATSS
ncbi:MAG: HNH endonuclease [Thermoleophilia bacterium]|nr:HNH endonuclease [Thermoleophilia bacterium]